jgi:hypothetical protein
VVAAGVFSFIATLFVREGAKLPLPEDIAPLSPSLLGTPA